MSTNTPGSGEPGSGELRSHDEPIVSVVPTVKPLSKQISRRKVFALAGAGTLVLVVGGGVWRATDQGVFSTGQGPAYTPWSDWRSATHGSLNLVRAAILAANAHNTQPWVFHVTTTRIDVFADLSRRIGLADPFLSEMYIGLGCALENIALAAPANGYTPQIRLLPDVTDATFVARIDLLPTVTRSSALYQAIPHRHTNRYPYDTNHPIAQATLDALSALNTDSQLQVLWMTGSGQRKQIGDLMIAAAKAFVADKPMSAEDNTWYRGTWQEVQQHRDGITLDASGLSDFTRVLGKMLPPESLDQQNGYFLQGLESQVQTAGALGLVAVRDKRDNVQRMSVGQLWQRMHLWATTQGLSLQPLNQITEMADREVVLGSSPHFSDALRALVTDPAWQGVFSFRAGYTTHEAFPSPRRALSDVVKS